MEARYRYDLLRLLVLAGCLPLLLRGPGVSKVRAQGHDTDCVTVLNQPNTQCSAPCTGTYTDYYTSGKGFQYANINPTPCGGGTSCTQPFTYGAPGFECSNCCLDYGTICTSDECNGQNPCCGYNTCPSGKCCTINGQPCEDPGNECCTGTCVNTLCCLSGLGGQCGKPEDCCGIAACQSGTCCGVTGAPCSVNSNCCSSMGLICNTYDYTCTTCSGAGGPCGGTPDCCPGSKLECKLPQKTCCVAKGGDCVDGSVCCSGVCNDFCECTG